MVDHARYIQRSTELVTEAMQESMRDRGLSQDSETALRELANVYRSGLINVEIALGHGDQVAILKDHQDANTVDLRQFSEAAE